MIATFPDFVEITLEHRAALENYLHQYPPLISELTFTNLFAWREVYYYRLCRFRDGFLIRKEQRGTPSFLQPLVPHDPAGALRECLAYLAAHTPHPYIERVGEDVIAQLGDAAEKFDIREDRDDFDYVYSVKELIELRGPKFHNKKNLLNQFITQTPYRYMALTEEMVPTCLEFAHAWCEEKRCEQDETLSHENCAVVQMLLHFHELGMVGGMLEIEGKPAAFTLGEALNPETFVIHVEKASRDYPGIYQTINRDFLCHAAADYTYVNREQDLGIPGLRKAKESYNPVRMVKKYRVGTAG